MHVGGMHMVHEREDNFTCGPIMPQGGIQVFLILNIFFKKNLNTRFKKKELYCFTVLLFVLG